ncbi:Vacuolar protein sorting protein vps66 [Rhizoctonia solani]|uniref:Vacuolar protein sorting protein vps66 n=1 Tax=Rhizoctonia solani TaxID=456999 RepID=A0A8H7M878_9AGAM|nr:Vacuolar protein sorting protein vps66 [Rhizoctonia solani]
MEKFSAWRDPGTGVQATLFDTRAPQSTKSLADYGAAAFGIVFGVFRSILALILLALFVAFHLVCVLLLPIPPLHRFFSWLVIAILGRIFLCLLGFWSISTYVASRKNRYNPQFVLPVCASPTLSATQTTAPATPGRRTGTGSAQNGLAPRDDPRDWTVPPYGSSTSTVMATIEDIRAQCDRPLVVLPECTTSNGRALIRFADVFVAGKGKHIKHPVKGFKMYIMCARYDPPTITTPSPTHSIPSQSGTLPNPAPHIVKLLFAPALAQSLSIRLVAPSDSPSSGSFMASEVILDNGIAPADEISEACAVLMAQASKLKRVGMGWEDKAAFLDFYRKRKSL